MQAHHPAADSPAEHSLLLDNWRGWAIIFVIGGHFAHVPAVDAGRVGVELFFVLSGRLMADLLFVRQTPIPTFFQRRFTRVLPLSLLFVATAWFAFPPGPLYLPDRAALASLGMLVNYTQLIGASAPVTDHYWSLCVEEHSYLVLSVVAVGSLSSYERLPRRTTSLLVAGLIIQTTKTGTAATEMRLLPVFALILTSNRCRREPVQGSGERVGR